MSTAVTHAQNVNLKSLFNLTSACTNTVQLKAENFILNDEAPPQIKWPWSTLLKKKKEKIHYPTIEQILNHSDIKDWDKQLLGRVVWQKVVIPEA